MIISNNEREIHCLSNSTIHKSIKQMLQYFSTIQVLSSENFIFKKKPQKAMVMKNIK